jgi:microcin C transport system substrate-binding protein
MNKNLRLAFATLCVTVSIPAFATAQEALNKAVPGKATGTISVTANNKSATNVAASKRHGMALYGEPKYGADFKHYEYVNPNAPKGGTLRLAGYDTFDNLNPFIIKGVTASGADMIYQSLLDSSADEAFSAYGNLAESVETPDDRSWVQFTIRPEAKWHDGKPVTAEDVKWTFETLIEKGSPFYRSYYSHVKSVDVISDRVVKFNFDMANNLELPLIVGQIQILPKHYWTSEGREFENSTLTPPLGSGPYKFGNISPGRSIEYQRVADWWAKDLPVNKGRYNFDRIVYEYFKDQNVAMEAFFAGQYDFRQEYTAKFWANSYDAAPVKSGKIKKEEIANTLPQGMQGFVLNLRRKPFQDLAVRKAINYAFDYEWSNKQFAYDLYKRTGSYFSNSEMASSGLPSKEELVILEPLRDILPASVFTEEFKNPKTDGSGNNRANLREASRLLDEAGWVLNKDGVREKDGVKLEFEFLVATVNEAFVRWFQPMMQNLSRIGIKAQIRTVDATQYTNRVMAFDYDMIVTGWAQSNSPGNEQREFWESNRAHVNGSRNYIGLEDKAIDSLVNTLVAAPTREDLVIRARALDRVLLNGWYVVPNWHTPTWRVAYWDKFGKPEKQAPYKLGVSDLWWSKDAK